MVYLRELLRMDRDCLLEIGSQAKGNQMCGSSRQVPGSQVTSVGEE